ncbi:MAG: hypothetical protein ABI402_04975 [Ferruginibacter sp.]
MFALASEIFITGNVIAQDTTMAVQYLKAAANKTADAVDKTANKVGKKTARIAANTKAMVIDKVYEGKVTPGRHRAKQTARLKCFSILDQPVL